MTQDIESNDFKDGFISIEIIEWKRELNTEICILEEKLRNVRSVRSRLYSVLLLQEEKGEIYYTDIQNEIRILIINITKDKWLTVSEILIEVRVNLSVKRNIVHIVIKKMHSTGILIRDETNKNNKKYTIKESAKEIKDEVN